MSSDYKDRNEAKALALAGVASIKQKLAGGRIFHKPSAADAPNLPLQIMSPEIYALHQEIQKSQDIAYGFEETFPMSPPGSKWIQAGGKKWAGNPPVTRYNLKDGENVLSSAYVFKVPGPVPTAWYVVQVCRKKSSSRSSAAAAAGGGGDEDEEDEEDGMEVDPETITVQGTVCDEFDKGQISASMSSGQQLPTPFHVGNELQEDIEWIKVDKSLVVNNICVKGRISCLSDESTKTNIKELKLDVHFQKLMEQIMKLKPITFDDALKQSRVGFSANNIQSVLPKCVSTLEFVNGNEAALTVDPMGIVAYLVLTVQGFSQQYERDFKAILQMLVEDRPLRDLVEYRKIPLAGDTETESESSNTANGSRQERRTEKLSEKDVGKQIAQDLDEPNVNELIDRVRAIGIAASLNLRDQLLEDPPNDGRTLGGHFFRKSKSIQKSGASKDALKQPGLYGKARDYQFTAVEAIGSDNAILVLPTGLGKTLVACMVVENALNKRPGCALFITQDRELARQQAAKFYRDGPPAWRRSGAILLAMGGDDIQKLTKKPDGLTWESSSIQLNTMNWKKIVGEATILFITAGALVDTILCPKSTLKATGTTSSEPIQLDNIPIVVLDEAHHAGEGSHNFVLALNEFTNRKMKAQLLGLSASPVSGTCDESQLRVRLRDLQRNLWNAKVVVPFELKTIESLASMTLTRTNPLELELELIDIVSELVQSIKEYCLGLGGFATPMPQAYGETFVDWAHERSVYFARNGDKERAAACFALFRIVTSWLLIEDIGAIAANDLVSAILILQVHHSSCDEVLELILKPFVCEIARVLSHPDFHSTKLVKLKSLLQSGESKKTLIRVATRRGVFWLTNHLQSQGFRAAALVGRSLMNESKIRQALNDFGRGDIDILVGTSMVEEGIDLQNCDMVIAFSVLRLLNSGKSLIQNAGRARQSGSKLLVLCSNLEEELQFSKLTEQVKAMFRVVNCM